MTINISRKVIAVFATIALVGGAAWALPANAGDVVDAVVTAGENLIQVNSVSPFVLNATAASNIARADVVAKAKAKAAAYAKLLDLKLGQVNYLIENYSPSNVVPAGIYSKERAFGDSATVIDLGEQDISVSITIQWELL